MKLVNIRFFIVILIFFFKLEANCQSNSNNVFKVNINQLDVFLKEAYTDEEVKLIYDDTLRLKEIKEDLSGIRIVKANKEFVKRFPELELKKGVKKQSNTFENFNPHAFNPLFYELDYGSNFKKNAYHLENTAYYIVIVTKK